MSYHLWACRANSLQGCGGCVMLGLPWVNAIPAALCWLTIATCWGCFSAHAQHLNSRTPTPEELIAYSYLQAPDREQMHSLRNGKRKRARTRFGFLTHAQLLFYRHCHFQVFLLQARGEGQAFTVLMIFPRVQF